MGNSAVCSVARVEFVFLTFGETQLSLFNFFKNVFGSLHTPLLVESFLKFETFRSFKLVKAVSLAYTAGLF